MIDWQARYENARALAAQYMAEREKIASDLRKRDLYLQPDGSVKTQSELATVSRLTAPSH